jgi:hypothetical protein
VRPHYLGVSSSVVKAEFFKFVVFEFGLSILSLRLSLEVKSMAVQSRGYSKTYI